MAYSRQETQLGKVIYFTYNPTLLFDRAQQLSQYHSSANKDKNGNELIDIAFSSDNKEYFDSWCRKAIETIGRTFIRVNNKALLPYTYTNDSKDYVASINVTDHGFVKDSLLSVIDEVIEKCIVDFVLYKWYEHLGVEPLVLKFSNQVNDATIVLKQSLEQFLRKVYIVQWFPKMQWSNPLCVQVGFSDYTMSWDDAYCVQTSNYLVTARWTEPVCVQDVTNTYSMEWTNPVCVQDLFMKSMKWTNPVCVQDSNYTVTAKWSNPICVQDVFSIFSMEWSNELCVQTVSALDEEVTL